MASKHPGFAAVQSKISKSEGVSKDRAGAILAASSRGASKKAKKANPRLHRVKGGNSIAGPMKSAALTGSRSHNLAAKDFFVKSQANKSASINLNQDADLAAARTHNMSADEHFDSGTQKATNLADKCAFADGKNRPSGKFGR